MSSLRSDSTNYNNFWFANTDCRGILAFFFFLNILRTHSFQLFTAVSELWIVATILSYEVLQGYKKDKVVRMAQNITGNTENVCAITIGSTVTIVHSTHRTMFDADFVTVEESLLLVSLELQPFLCNCVYIFIVT